MLRSALTETGLPVLGVLPRRDALTIPERHLGLVLPDEIAAFDAVVAAAAEVMPEFLDVPRLLSLAAPLAEPHPEPVEGRGYHLPPLAQRLAIARDDAFAFLSP